MITSSNCKAIALIVLATAGCSVQVTPKPKRPEDRPGAAASTKPGGPVQPPPSIPQAALQSAAGDPATKAFYTPIGWQAAWSPNAAKALDKALDERPRDGLDHIDFGTMAPQADAAQGDVQRTRVALAYASALAHGMADPTMLHKVHTVPRPDPDLHAGLAAALRAGTVGAWFEGLAPQDADYRALSVAYLSYRKAAPTPAPSKPLIPDVKSIHSDDHDPRIGEVASQLVSEGYLPSAATQQTGGGASTQPIADAVKRMQIDYGIKPDGTIGSDTLGQECAGARQVRQEGRPGDLPA